MSKRFIAAGVAAMALFGIGASAQGALKTYTDPQNRFTFQYPASLPVDVVARPNQPVNVLVGAADYECQIFVVERPNTVGKLASDMVRDYAAPFAPDMWKRSADGFALYGRQGTLVSESVDTSRYWPLHRASMRTDDGKPVVAALQARQGVEVWQFCTGFDGRDHTAVFNQIIDSFAGPTDDADRAAAAAAAAAPAATAAETAAPAPPAAGENQKKKRGH